MSDEEDKEFYRELMRLAWQADPWNRLSRVVDLTRLAAFITRLVVALIQAITG